MSEALELLQETLSEDESGFQEVIDCITAWQDLIDNEDSALRPLLECLHENDVVVSQKSIALVNALIRHAPDEARAFRIKNELAELNYSSHLEHIRSRGDPNLLSEIQQFRCLFGTEKSDEVLPDSIDVSAVMNTERLTGSIHSTVQPTDPLKTLLADLESLLLEDSACRARVLVVEKLVELLREIKTMDEAEEVFKALRANRSKAGADVLSNSTTILPSSAVNSTSSPHKPPPPPPFKLQGSTKSSISLDRTSAVAPPPPPPPSLVAHAPTGIILPSGSKQRENDLPESMKPIKAPSEAIKMKTIMWSKITPATIVTGQGSQSVWGELARKNTKIDLDYDMIDGMFSITQFAQQPLSDSSPSQSCRKKGVLVDLLTLKRSQNVTIILKQFKNLDMVISCLRDNKVEQFDLEKLRTLRSILPDSDEVNALRRYTGEISQLTPACSFFLRLLDVPDYCMRIDCMILRLEFHRIMEEVVPGIYLLKEAAKELRDSNALRRLLLLIVNIGNYLNSSSTHGCAAGFKLSSIWKVIDHRAIKGTSSLLHLIAKMDPALLKELEHELPSMIPASENSVEEIKTSLRSLGEKCTTLGHQLKLKQGTEFEEIRQYLEDHCYIELEVTNQSLKEMLRAEDSLAVFFCESKASFKIEECLKIFKNLITRLRQAVQENEEQERRLLRKDKSKIVEFDEKNQKAEGEQREKNFLATLEKGHNLHRRRRIPVCASEPERDRKAADSSSVRKLIIEPTTKTDPTKHEVQKLKQHSNSKSSSATSQNSELYNGVLYLNDYVEILEKQSSMGSLHRYDNTKSRITSFVSKKEQEAIELNIPSNSDSVTITSESSPKSASDEGFESEKDKENSILPLPTASTANKSKGKDSRNSDVVHQASTSSVELPSQPRPLLAVKAPSDTKLLKPTKVKKSISENVTQSERDPSNLSSSSRLNITQCKSSLPVASSASSRQNTSRSSTGRSSQNSTSPSQTGKLGRISVSKSTVPLSHTTCTEEDMRFTKKRVSLSGVDTADRATSTLLSPSVSNRRMKATSHQTSRDYIVSQPRRAFISRITNSAEERDILLKPQVSTSSRPSLIKTGSLPQSSKLPKMSVTERPKPLRRTSEQANAAEIAGKNVMTRPKWI